MLAIAGYVALGVLYLALLTIAISLGRAASNGDQHIHDALRASRERWSWDAGVDGDWTWPR